MKPATDREEQLLNALEDCILQACRTRDDNVLDSWALSAYADAMYILEEYGRLEIVKDFGRRVIAKPVNRPTSE